jgi:hypothetical protein
MLIAERWSLLSRVAAAVLGGYAVTSLINTILPLLLADWGMDEIQAFIAVSMATFLVYAALIIAAFTVRSARGAWIVILVTAIPFGVAFVALDQGRL